MCNPTFLVASIVNDSMILHKTRRAPESSIDALLMLLLLRKPPKLPGFLMGESHDGFAQVMPFCCLSPRLRRQPNPCKPIK